MGKTQIRRILNIANIRTNEDHMHHRQIPISECQVEDCGDSVHQSRTQILNQMIDPDETQDDLGLGHLRLNWDDIDEFATNLQSSDDETDTTLVEPKTLILPPPRITVDYENINRITVEGSNGPDEIQTRITEPTFRLDPEGHEALLYFRQQYEHQIARAQHKETEELLHHFIAAIDSINNQNHSNIRPSACLDHRCTQHTGGRRNLDRLRLRLHAIGISTAERWINESENEQAQSSRGDL
jgi:hypothetical protein